MTDGRIQGIAVSIVLVCVSCVIASLSLPHVRVLDCNGAEQDRTRCTRWQQLDMNEPPFVLAHHEAICNRDARALVEPVVDEGSTYYRLKVETGAEPFYWGRTHSSADEVADNARAMNAFFASSPRGHLRLEERGFFWFGLPIAGVLFLLAIALGFWPAQE